jgi:hypothetical protein
MVNMIDMSMVLLSTVSAVMAPSEQVEVALAYSALLRDVVGHPFGGPVGVLDMLVLLLSLLLSGAVVRLDFFLLSLGCLIELLAILILVSFLFVLFYLNLLLSVHLILSPLLRLVTQLEILRTLHEELWVCYDIILITRSLPFDERLSPAHD